MDISGWYIGEAGKQQTKMPEGTILKFDDQLKLFGHRTETLGHLEVSADGTIGDGLIPGDVLVMMTDSLTDTLVYEKIPEVPDGKIILKRKGRWSTPLAFESVEEVILRPPNDHISSGTTRIDTVKYSVMPARVMEPSPNPFNAQTQFGFYSDGNGCRVTVYSVLGQSIRLLVNQVLPVGFHTQIWDGTDEQGRPAGTGVYLLHVQSERVSHTCRVALLR